MDLLLLKPTFVAACRAVFRSLSPRDESGATKEPVNTITLEFDPEGNGDPSRAESVFPVWALLLCPATRGL